MGKVNITFPGNLGQVESVADLRSVPSYFLPDGLIYIAKEAKRSFTFDTSATGADDGLNIVKPNDLTPAQAGRWVYAIDGIAPGPEGKTGPADNTYSSYAAMQASDPTRKSARLVGDTDIPPHPDGPYNNPTQTVGGWVPQQADGVAYGQQVNIALPLDRSIPRTLAFMAAVDPFTTASQQSKLESAFADAVGEGYKLTAHPDANYRHDGPLTLGNSFFDGLGATFTPLSNGRQGLIITGANGGVRNVTTLGAAVDRDAGFDEANGVYVHDASGFLIENVIVGSVDPSASAPRGHALAAFLFRNCFDGKVSDCHGEWTRADGFHFTDGTSRIQAEGCSIERSGDDSFAIVSYVAQGRICTDIVLTNPVSYNSGSRGIAFVGGARNSATTPRITGSAAAAAYIASEDGFNTTGNLHCHITGMAAYGAVQGAPHLGPNFQNAAVMMLGRSGSDTIGGEIYSRSAVDCSITGSVHRAGDRCSAIIDVSGPYAIRPVIDIASRDMVGASSPSGVLLGGVDAKVRLHADNVGGLPVLVNANAAGKALLQLSGDAMRTQAAGPDAVIFAFAAPNLESLRTSATVTNAPATWLIDSGPNGDKLRWRDTTHNGFIKPGKDYTQAEPTYTGGASRASFSPLLLRRFPTGEVSETGAFTISTAVTSGTTIGTVPAGYRPAVPAYSMIRSGTSLLGFRVEAGGNIVAETDMPTGTYGVNTSWIATQ